MTEEPKVKSIDSGKIWSNSFENFQATVYVPEADPDLKSDIINYGFVAPYLLIFPEKKLSKTQAVDFALEKGFAELAASFASSVVFIYPASGSWESAAPDIFAKIIDNSRIHQYYQDGFIHSYNRFSQKLEGYYIRGAIFRTCLFGYGKGADYIARNCLKHFEGNGLWGRSDLAPVTCILNSLSAKAGSEELKAIYQCPEDIPVLSYNNSDEINQIFAQRCQYFFAGEDPDANGLIEDFYGFTQKFRRMNGPLQLDPNLKADGLISEPGFVTVNTSADNNGDDKGTKTHNVGYLAFYNNNIKAKVPMVLGFHGGGDSAAFFAVMAGWAKIAHRHGFLLVCIENHLNSSATEMQEVIASLKEKYPVDESRIYVTGFSMGGIKSWDMIQEFPLSIAAAAPMDATVDIGENVYFQKIQKPVNTSVQVPIFYAGGELTPLAELPCQEQKCLNRMKYALELNHATTVYDVKLADKDNWKNKIWGIDGDIVLKAYDKSRDATLTMNLFRNDKGKVYNVFASISGQGHDCREHTCEHAWNFMSQFRRTPDGIVHGGDEQTVINALTN